MQQVGVREKGVALAKGNGKSLPHHTPLPLACLHRIPGTPSLQPPMIQNQASNYAGFTSAFLKGSGQLNQSRKGLWFD